MPHFVAEELPPPLEKQTALSIFSAMEYHDTVDDGDLLEVVRYLRGSTKLRIPTAEWRAVLPGPYF